MTGWLRISAETQILLASAAAARKDIQREMETAADEDRQRLQHGLDELSQLIDETRTIHREAMANHE